MFTDSTGYAPEWWDEIKEKVTKWLVDVPNRSDDSLSAFRDSIYKFLGSVSLGVGLSFGANHFSSKAVHYVANRGNPLSGVSIFFKGLGNGVSGTVTILRSIDLWVGDNGFSNIERLSLIGVEIAGTISLGLIVGSATTAIFGAATVTASTVLVPLAAVAIIGTTVYIGTNALYDYCQRN